MRWTRSEVMARLLPSRYGGTSCSEGASEPLARDSDKPMERDEYVEVNKSSLAPPCPVSVNQRTPINRSSRPPTMPTNSVSDCRPTSNTAADTDSDEGASKPPNITNNQPTPAAVRAAVAIAAGKKGVSMERSQSKKPVSRTLCLLYWLLVLATCSLITFTIWLSVQLAQRQHQNVSSSGDGMAKKTAFTMDDVFNSSFQPKSFNVQWINDTTYAHLNSDSDLVLCNVKSNKTIVLVDRSFFAELNTKIYSVSYDARYVLLTHNVKRIWKHSYLADYKVYNVKAKRRIEKLIEFPLGASVQSGSVQNVQWAPGSHAMTFTKNGNLYFQRNPASAPTPLTTNGDGMFIFHGIADWLYEESVMGGSTAHWWSPDGVFIAYASFNTTNVKQFSYPYYGSDVNLFGSAKQFTYPKAANGRRSNITSVSIYVASTQHPDHLHQLITPPETLQNRDNYVIQVAWKDETNLAVVWVNRAQNKSITMICSIQSAVSCTENHYYVQHQGWIDPLPDMLFIRDGRFYLTVLPRMEGSSGQWNQLALVSAETDDLGSVIYLTTGQKDVIGIAGFDPTTETVYFYSTAGDPRSKQLMKHPISESSEPVCMTCADEECKYAEAVCSIKATYCVLGCLGPAVPSYKLVNLKQNKVVVLEDNQALKNLLLTKLLPTREYDNISLGGGFTGYANSLIPVKETPEGTPRHKYPLLVNVRGSYRESGSTYKFSLGLDTVLASTHRALIVSVDGRGAPGQGSDFRHSIYKRMGQVDAEDQLLLAQWFLDNKPYIDKHKAPAVYGWSDGGFVAAHAFANDTNIFPCGVIGAAMTDLHYSDTAYAERLMGFADLNDNAQGYEAASVKNKVEHLKQKLLLMIHNIGDDYIRLSGSANLIETLTNAKMQFRFQLYSNMHHHSEYHERHVYDLITDFLVNTCWSQIWHAERLIWKQDPSKKRTQFLRKEICV